MSSTTPQVAIMQGFLGEIRIFTGQKAPENWAFCEGQLLSIQEYGGLFSLLRTAYGGDGKSTFALPDTRGRVMVGMGKGLGLSSRTLDESGGQETITLTEAEMPQHNHFVSSYGDGSFMLPAYNGDVGNTNSPVNAVFALEDEGNNVYGKSWVSSKTTTASWNETFDKTLSVSNTGGTEAHSNIMPVVAVNYIMCISNGQYPERGF